MHMSKFVFSTGATGWRAQRILYSNVWQKRMAADNWRSTTMELAAFLPNCFWTSVSSSLPPAAFSFRWTSEFTLPSRPTLTKEIIESSQENISQCQSRYEQRARASMSLNYEICRWLRFTLSSRPWKTQMSRTIKTKDKERMIWRSTPLTKPPKSTTRSINSQGTAMGSWETKTELNKYSIILRTEKGN